MSTLRSVSVALLLTVGATLPAVALPRLPDSLGRPGPQEPGLAKPPGLNVRELVATIQAIDYQQGVLEVETELGRLQFRAAPEEMQELKAGDTLLVYVLEEDPAHNLLHDSITT
jgi:hypothetical protein